MLSRKSTKATYNLPFKENCFCTKANNVNIWSIVCLCVFFFLFFFLSSWVDTVWLTGRWNPRPLGPSLCRFSITGHWQRVDGKGDNFKSPTSFSPSHYISPPCLVPSCPTLTCSRCRAKLSRVRHQHVLRVGSIYDLSNSNMFPGQGPALICPTPTCSQCRVQLWLAQQQHVPRVGSRYDLSNKNMFQGSGPTLTCPTPTCSQGRVQLWLVQHKHVPRVGSSFDLSNTNMFLRSGPGMTCQTPTCSRSSVYRYDLSSTDLVPGSGLAPSHLSHTNLSPWSNRAMTCPVPTTS